VNAIVALPCDMVEVDESAVRGAASAWSTKSRSGAFSETLDAGNVLSMIPSPGSADWGSRTLNSFLTIELPKRGEAPSEEPTELPVDPANVTGSDGGIVNATESP